MNNNFINTSPMSFNDFFSEVECLNKVTRSNLVSHSDIWNELQKDSSSDHTWLSSKSEPAKQQRKALNDELRANPIVDKSFSEGVSAEYSRLGRCLRELSRTGIDSNLVRLMAPLQLMVDEPKKIADQPLNGDSMQDNVHLLAMAAMTSELLDEHLTQANQYKFEMQKLHNIAEQEKTEKLALREENQQLQKTKAALQQRISHNSRQSRRTKI